MNQLNLSAFGKKFAGDTGIYQLMVDLDAALNQSDDMIFLGGGNPAIITEVSDMFRDHLSRLISDPIEWRRISGVYDSSQGETTFIKELAVYLQKKYDWPVTEKNIALTNGSQTSFFYLFNMLAGRFEDNSLKRILLPMLPEYIGYSDVGINDSLFTGFLPEIEETNENGIPWFKYRLDRKNFYWPKDISLVCISRPTNPSGNVITDEEFNWLASETEKLELPLLVDNAYGQPFPNVMFTEANPVYRPHIIHTLSLSKLGLPGARTGVVIADEKIIAALSKVNAIASLSTGSFGPAIAARMLASGAIDKISNQIIQPFYQKKSGLAVAELVKAMDGFKNYRIHRSEGAFFLWLWFPGLPISSQELYQKLKERNVLVVPGHYYFPGHDENWPHKDECLRVSFAQNEEMVGKGMQIMADEVKKAFKA